MDNSSSKDLFIEAAFRYIEDLRSASSFDEIVEKWRSTSHPYEICSRDPHGDEYRNEILDIYCRLTGGVYDVHNEWTSTLQTAEQFEQGYPWVSKNLGVIAEEIAKPIQVMRAIQEIGKKDIRAIEFGSGWGNLSIPLAKSGVDVTMVDIDSGFLERSERIACREGVPVKSICGEFLQVAQGEHGTFDVIIFQSAFHHCLEFEELVRALRTNMLAPGGALLFVNEPISDDLRFPWGLRYDGESLWAIMCNKWLELGFHSDFFSEMLLRNGMLPQSLPSIPSLLDAGWKATIGRDGIEFSRLRLPRGFSSTFHEPDGVTLGRFCRGASTLPRLGGQGSATSGYELEFANYSLFPLAFSINFGSERSNYMLQSGDRIIEQFSSFEHILEIESDTFVPHEQNGSDDFRLLGISLDRVSTF